jgi:membrane protease YdiL (CAAX protease family)
MEILSDIPTREALAALIIIIVAYYAYYFSAFSKVAARWFQRKYNGKESLVYFFIYQKFLGFMFLGFIPALIFLIFFGQEFRIREPIIVFPVNMWLLMPFLLGLIFTMSYFSTRKTEIQSRLPQIRNQTWSPGLIAISVGGWAIYLLGYEFIFRDLLLFTWVDAYGIAPAIAINLALYSAFHLPNGIDETLGSLLFGFILCMVTLQTGSFIMAFMLHLSLSASSEMFAIYRNPEMQIKIRKE